MSHRHFQKLLLRGFVIWGGKGGLGGGGEGGGKEGESPEHIAFVFPIYRAARFKVWIHQVFLSQPSALPFSHDTKRGGLVVCREARGYR